MKKHLAMIPGVLLAAALAALPLGGQEAPLNATEKALADQINKVRLDNGRTAVEISTSLTQVARVHVGDLNAYHPDTGEDNRGEECNLHSWSSHGTWQPVCYTDDHAYASLMYSKPRELTAFTANGYEIATFYSGGMTPETAVASWKGSPDHLDVILEQGTFAGHPWKAMGVGISGNYACVWFGETVDPAGPLAAAAVQPAVSTDYPDSVGFAGGLSLSIADATIAFNQPLKIILGLAGRNAADLTDCRFQVQKKVAGGWQRIFRSHKSFFKNLTMTPGQVKHWEWDRRVDEGQPAPGPGKYRVRFKAPRYTSDIIVREFEIRG
jgi:hypothetical protein